MSAVPTVSVLMPTFNRAPFLGAAIASVLAQRDAELELIVVDDGSTDATEGVLAGFDDRRVTVLRRAHGGVRAALNAGLRVSRGRFIARNDSDDVWLPDLLTRTVPVLEADARVGAVYGRAEHIDGDGVRIEGGRGTPLRLPDAPLRSLLRTDYTCAVTTVFRREAIERAGGWTEGMLSSEDWEMILRTALHYDVRFVDHVIAHVRLHGGNTIARRDYAAHALSDRLRILESVLADPATPPALVAESAGFRREIYIGTALQYVDLGSYVEALRALAGAVAVGGNPVRSGARIAWCALNWLVIARHGWSRDLARRLATHLRGALPRATA